jgi:hypothetical protein
MRLEIYIKGVFLNFKYLRVHVTYNLVGILMKESFLVRLIYTCQMFVVSWLLRCQDRLGEIQFSIVLRRWMTRSRGRPFLSWSIMTQALVPPRRQARSNQEASPKRSKTTTWWERLRATSSRRARVMSRISSKKNYSKTSKTLLLRDILDLGPNKSWESSAICDIWYVLKLI